MATYTPDQFAARLLSVVAKAPGETRDVTEQSARKVRDGARRNATAANPVHARGVVQHINYDVDPPGVLVGGEVGYDKRGQGHLGAILEYANGGARNNPQRNLGRALDLEEKTFPGALQQMGERLLGDS